MRVWMKGSRRDEWRGAEWGKITKCLRITYLFSHQNEDKTGKKDKSQINWNSFRGIFKIESVKWEKKLNGI